MTQHTPGPWYTCGFENLTVNAHIENGITTIVVMPGGTPYAPMTELKANAALIASAPALLTALEAMLEVQSKRRHPLGAPDEGIAYMAAQAAANARDAIKAAKGEA